jgi:hypothetical protein
MSVSVDLFLFSCFQDNLEYHYVLVPQEVFVGYDQTITNGVGPASLELVLPQICPVHHIVYLIFYSNCIPLFTVVNFLLSPSGGYPP